MKDITQYRKSYEKDQLDDSDVTKNPFELFQIWFDEVDSKGGLETNAMTVSTIGIDGFPKSRVVLLKELKDGNYTFYTNYESEKGRALEYNPNVCISFFWHTLERQVIIKGTAEKTSSEMSDSYFASRPEGSKLGALASHQSEVIPSREVLEKRLYELEQQFAGSEIPRPGYWGGYTVSAIEIEFWQGRKNRLHDRIRYKLEDGLWKSERLSP